MELLINLRIKGKIKIFLQVLNKNIIFRDREYLKY